MASSFTILPLTSGLGTKQTNEVFCWLYVLCCSADGNACRDKQMNTEQIEVRTWSVVVLTLNFILFGSVAAILYAVMFVEHDLERISPIDQQFLAILKDIMLLCIGAVGGLVGRKGAYAAANMISKEKDDSTRPTA